MDHNLLASPDSLSKIFDLAEEAIVSVDEQQRIILFNQGAERMFLYSAGEVRGQPLDILLPSRFAEAHRNQIRSFEKLPVSGRRMADRGRILGRRKDGTEFPAEASISKVALNGSMTFTAIVRDITERVAAEEKILSTLKEKEVLLREIHHRVKNNLQIVASLLGLQSRGTSDEQMRRMLLESQNRVHSMALLHECLYQSPNLSQINTPHYIRQLVTHLYNTYEVSNGRIRLETELDPLYLDLDTAVACGLILNELVSNSLKYAFPGGREGVLRIELKADVNQMARLTVADNGTEPVTLPDLASAKTLGLRLVRTLAEQLGGTIEMRADAGVETRLTFPFAA